MNTETDLTQLPPREKPAKRDLTKPPNREATKLARLIPHLPRIEEARRLGWRIPEIQETLAEELGLEAMSNAAFRVLLATAQRRVAAQAAAPVDPAEDAQPRDLTAPPPGREPKKLARLIPHLPRIDQAMSMGWRLSEIQKSLPAELGVGSLSESAFRAMVSTARRRAAAQAAAPAAPAVQAVPAPVAPAAPTISTAPAAPPAPPAPPAPAPARSVDEKMSLLRADHARRAAAQAAELAADSSGAAPVAVAVAAAPVAVPAPAAVVAAPVVAAPAPAPAQKPAAAAGTLTRSEKLAQMRALQLAAPEPTDPTLIAALRVRKGLLKPDDSIVAKAAVEGLTKMGVLLCPPPDPEGKSIPAKLFNEVAAEYLKAVPQARLLIEEAAVEHQASWDPDQPYFERTDVQLHGNLVTAIKMANADRLRAAEAKAAAGS